MLLVFGHVIGTIGMVLVCIAFWLTTSERRKPTDNDYLWINLTGAILLLGSLLINFNLGSFMIEIFWCAISIHGLWVNYRKNNGKQLGS
ncbi:hypothetical protein VPHD479_0332 [Vibrio phage D479]